MQTIIVPYSLIDFRYSCSGMRTWKTQWRNDHNVALKDVRNRYRSTNTCPLIFGNASTRINSFQVLLHAFLPAAACVPRPGDVETSRHGSDISEGQTNSLNRWTVTFIVLLTTVYCHENFSLFWDYHSNYIFFIHYFYCCVLYLCSIIGGIRFEYWVH